MTTEHNAACAASSRLVPWNMRVVFLFAARTYFAMAVKAKSTLRPVLALVSMKGSPYSCKQLLPARCWPRGGSPRVTALGTPSSPTLFGLTLANFSPSSLFTTRSWAESTWPRHRSFVNAYPACPVGPGWRGQAHNPTLFPSSMSTTSCWAYSWISVSQACVGKAGASLKAGLCPLVPHLFGCVFLEALPCVD